MKGTTETELQDTLIDLVSGAFDVEHSCSPWCRQLAAQLIRQADGYPTTLTDYNVDELLVVIATQCQTIFDCIHYLMMTAAELLAKSEQDR